MSKEDPRCRGLQKRAACDERKTCEKKGHAKNGRILCFVSETDMNLVEKVESLHTKLSFFR